MFRMPDPLAGIKQIMLYAVLIVGGIVVIKVLGVID